MRRTAVTRLTRDVARARRMVPAEWPAPSADSFDDFECAASLRRDHHVSARLDGAATGVDGTSIVSVSTCCPGLYGP